MKPVFKNHILILCNNDQLNSEGSDGATPPLFVSQWPFYADEHGFNLLFVQLPLASSLFFSCLDLLTQLRQVFVSSGLTQQ